MVQKNRVLLNVSLYLTLASFIIALNDSEWCTSRASDLPYCTSEAGDEGSWERISLRTVNDSAALLKAAGYMLHEDNHKYYYHYCSHRSDSGEFKRLKEYFLWKWNPTGCRLFDTRDLPGVTKNDLSSLMHRLRDSKLLLVGDSIAVEQFFSLKALLAANSSTSWGNSVTVNGETRWGSVHFKVNSGFEVIQVRNDRLVNLRPGLEIHEPSGRDSDSSIVHYNVSESEENPQLVLNPYAHLLESPNTILVISTAPHWGGIGMDVYRDMIDRMLSHLDKKFSGSRVYVRTTPAGHPQCEQAQGPYSHFVYQNTTEAAYNWLEFPEHNRLWREGIRQAKNSKYRLLEVVNMTESRPDGHSTPKKDCLHYCLPGVIDYWNFLLLADLATMTEL